jgi:ribosome modulation factor
MFDLSSKALDEGIDAYCLGVPRGACPYRPSTKEYYDWLIGWDEAEELDFEETKDPS